MIDGHIPKEGEVLLYCPKLSRGSRPKPLLIAGNAPLSASSNQTLEPISAQENNPDFDTKHSDDLLKEAWLELVKLVSQSHAEDLMTQPAYCKLNKAGEHETLQVFKHASVVSPAGLKLQTPTDALAWLVFQYQQRDRLPRKLYAVGFKRFWRPTIEAFCQGSELVHVKNAEQVPAGETAVIWGLKPIQAQENVKVIRLEDGFLRSVGLGIQFARPLSWIPDRTGMYFNALQPSDLEDLLNTHTFSEQELAAASELIELIVATEITKYNTGDSHFELPQDAIHRTKILVTGQVESDASIHFGAPGIQTNLELVKAVRQANPDAYIVYKPHPDVVSKSRKVGADEHRAKDFADLQVTDASISQVMNAVDEVHVLTSLAGFEALLRRKPVACYGVPFYAGWGLTTDKCSAPAAINAYKRRTQRLTLEALVAGTLIKYPLYVSRENGYYSNAKQTLNELVAWRQEPPSLKVKFKKLVRIVMNLMFGAK